MVQYVHAATAICVSRHGAGLLSEGRILFIDNYYTSVPLAEQLLQKFYNNTKNSVDLSDQMTSYYSCLRKTVKWYKKIIIQLICGTCLINAWYVR